MIMITPCNASILICILGNGIDILLVKLLCTYQNCNWSIKLWNESLFYFTALPKLSCLHIYFLNLPLTKTHPYPSQMLLNFYHYIDNVTRGSFYRIWSYSQGLWSIFRMWLRAAFDGDSVVDEEAADYGSTMKGCLVLLVVWLFLNMIKYCNRLVLLIVFIIFEVLDGLAFKLLLINYVVMI